MEKEQAKKIQQNSEKMWAIQQEEFRRMQILQDREQKRKQRMVAENTKETHVQQQKEHMQKWKDPYNEKGPLWF